MEIRPVLKSESLAIAQFLQREMDQSVPVERWLRLFQYDWINPPIWGVAAFDGDSIVGFLGCIFSHSALGDPHLNCNLTSWCVARNYRGSGLGRLLFDFFLKEKRWQLNLLTAASYLVETYKSFGFEPYESHRYVFSPLEYSTKIKAYVDSDISLTQLSEADQKIFLDHKAHRCRQVHLELGSEHSFVVLKDIPRKSKLGFFSEVLYVSNPHFLQKNPVILSKLLMKNSDSLVALDKRYLSEKPRQGKEEALYSPRLCSSSLTPRPIFHAIYSEVVLLDLKM
jgi:ribosomal protein S18 acetylase RimI-like enzyme